MLLLVKFCSPSTVRSNLSANRHIYFLKISMLDHGPAALTVLPSFTPSAPSLASAENRPLQPLVAPFLSPQKTSAGFPMSF